MKVTVSFQELKNHSAFAAGMERLVTLLFGILIGVGGVYGFWWLSETGHESSVNIESPVVQPIAIEPQPAHILSPFEELEARITLAMASGDYRQAIDGLLEADLMAASPDEQDRVTLLLDEAVSALVEQLTPTAVDQLYESLTLAMPERAEYYILLAEHRIAMENPAAALPVLAQIENHHQLGALARQLIEQITSEDITSEDNVTDSLASLPLTQSGNQFIVSVFVDEQREVSLLIDTGASMTTLTPAVLRDLGYDLGGRLVNFSTASGVIQAPVVKVDSISLGPASIGGVVVGALDFSRPSGQVDGLLGMDVLQNFEFTLDQEQRRLELNVSERR